MGGRRDTVKKQKEPAGGLFEPSDAQPAGGAKPAAPKRDLTAMMYGGSNPMFTAEAFDDESGA